MEIYSVNTLHVSAVLFKIDFIVWKCNTTTTILPNMTLFKIDFIVWKLKQLRDLKIPKTGLK